MARSKETRKFSKDLTRVARRKFTPEDKTHTVLSGFSHDIPIRDLRRKEDIHPVNYYIWLKDFMEEDKKRLKHGTICEETKAGVQEIKRGDSIYIITIPFG